MYEGWYPSWIAVDCGCREGRLRTREKVSTWRRLKLKIGLMGVVVYMAGVATVNDGDMGRVLGQG